MIDTPGKFTTVPLLDRKQIHESFLMFGAASTAGFVPVATDGALKCIDIPMIDKAADQQLMFCNTYHLLLQPGPGIDQYPQIAGACIMTLHAAYHARCRPLSGIDAGYRPFSAR